MDKDGVPDEAWKSLSRASRIISESRDYHFRTEKAESLFDQIQVSGRIQDLSHLIFDMATHYGFKHGTLFLLQSGSTGGIWSHRVCTSLPERWLQHYKESEYQYIDPTIFSSLTSRQPVFVGRACNDSPRVTQFWNDVDRYKIGSTVYCGSHKTRSGATVGFSFVSENSERACTKKIRFDESDIFKLTGSLAAVFEELSAKGNGNLEELSQQELLFLRSVLLGKSTDDPINYGGFKVCPMSVQAAISRKLGVDTILQAVAVAASRGWLDEVSYSSGEVHTIFENLPNIEDLKLRRLALKQ